MQKLGSSTVTTVDDVESLVFDWGRVQMLSEGKISGGATMSFGVVSLEPGKGHDRHNHPDADEVLYFVSGSGEQMLEDYPPIPVGPGVCVFIPQGKFHSTVNTGSGPLTLIVVYAPAGAEQALREIPGVVIEPAKNA